MAETNVYELRIIPEAEEEKSPVAGKKGKTKAEKRQARFERTVKGLVSYDNIKGTIDSIATYRIGKVNLQTGASEYEQRLSTVYQSASSTVDLAKSTIMAGVAGGVPLAVFTLLMKGLTSVFDIYKKFNMVGAQRNLEGISISMQNRRAGTSGRRSGTQ